MVAPIRVSYGAVGQKDLPQKRTALAAWTRRICNYIAKKEPSVRDKLLPGP